MLRGFLIYSISDYEKNKWFVGEFLTKAARFDFSIELIFIEHVRYIGRKIRYRRETIGDVVYDLEDFSFAINRSRNLDISVYLEKHGIRVFNDSTVTKIANDKWKTYDFVKDSGVRTASTMLINRALARDFQSALDYPLVLKSLDGHGGAEVFLANNSDDLIRLFDKIGAEEGIVQEFIPDALGDVRVYAMGGNVIAAVKRVAHSDFRANISLGGVASDYNLSKEDRLEVDKVLGLWDFDFVGIDFIIDDRGFVFNEIEDAVGTRSLYSEYHYDVVSMYLKYISDVLRRV